MFQKMAVIISGITGKTNGLVYSIILPITNLLGWLFIIGSILAAIISMDLSLPFTYF